MSSQIVFPWKQRKLHHNEKPILHKNGRDFQLISVERGLIYLYLAFFIVLAYTNSLEMKCCWKIIRWPTQYISTGTFESPGLTQKIELKGLSQQTNKLKVINRNTKLRTKISLNY